MPSRSAAKRGHVSEPGVPIGNKGSGPALVSAAARAGKPGAVYLSFPYEPFEQSLLVWGYDLQLEDVLPRKGSDLKEQLRVAEGRVSDLDHRVDRIKAKVSTA